MPGFMFVADSSAYQVNSWRNTAEKICMGRHVCCSMQEAPSVLLHHRVFGRGVSETVCPQTEPHSLPLDLVLILALDIAHGMHYLHSQGILHRDLKSENLLLGEDMCVKVVDFGISCLESQCGSREGIMGTYRWMAPEMIKEKHHTRKVDVYRFDIVLWELLSTLIPFHDMTPEQAAFAVSQKMLVVGGMLILERIMGSIKAPTEALHPLLHQFCRTQKIRQPFQP
ncbi:serine/threonine/tyrosine-protein kinase HT1-like [Magnolia sinica]|uniref:serine/threonine/tyrosine-protein kinase HT1-like n=1 Tax=Magnolia sinica TaxID=86752 RepID=UPI00265A0ECA|nr:serine/threonine/tyrosine-protein kinase HT1-like [Magnolia sinica]